MTDKMRNLEDVEANAQLQASNELGAWNPFSVAHDDKVKGLPLKVDDSFRTGD